MLRATARMTPGLSSTKLPLQALPLPHKSHILTQNLTSDEFTLTAQSFYEDVLPTKPSLQRRARLLDQKAHFSFVSPFLYPFPYRIEVEDDMGTEERTTAVEKWLSDKEAIEEIDIGESVLKGHASSQRIKDYHLIGLASRVIEECLPSLDVGDAFALLDSPALTKQPNANEGVVSHDQFPTGPMQVRQILIDVLSGHTVLSNPSPESGYAPWSLRYSGHQFGNWAGQLGDGRAISILETPHPDDPDLTYELQLKGAGRTPFSRGADGLAVLRSSIREYLGAEAVHALGIPTTRSLSIIIYPSLPVYRESLEKAAVVARVAPSFIRIGNFEAVNPPQNVFSFTFTGQQDADWEALRILGEWVAHRVLQLKFDKPGSDNNPPPWGYSLVQECARKNAKMVAGWQAYGFMHGVMNTDNISILGLTIDYGPYAFMDVFEENHICNHTDDEGRYAYRYQTTMVVYAIRALLTSLSPLIGAEKELGRAVPAGWADHVPKEKFDKWREDGMELQKEVEGIVLETFADQYWSLMRKRFGLRKNLVSDPNEIIRPFLKLLELHELDFHSSFRILCSFKPSLTDVEVFVMHLMPEYSSRSMEGRESARRDMKQWLEIYASRIQKDSDEWDSQDTSQWLEGRETEMKKVNPRFVLRQWVLEEVIKRVEEDYLSGRQVLAKVLQMCSNPFEAWGAENDPTADEELDTERREEKRYCEMGPKKFLGFQCSCSS